MPSAVEEMRELLALEKAYNAEISACKSYLTNTARWEAEMARELQKLQWQQAIVDRLKARHGEEGEAKLNEWHDKLTAVKQRILVVKNQAAIETLLRLQREMDELNGKPHPVEQAAPVQAACEAVVEEEPVELVQVHLVCDGCLHHVFGSDELADEPCPRCRTGVLVETDDEPVIVEQHESDAGEDSVDHYEMTAMEHGQDDDSPDE